VIRKAVTMFQQLPSGEAENSTAFIDLNVLPT
jgi:hypothetical protein